jgi:hypothetical protein
VEDIEVKKFFNENGEGHGNEIAKKNTELAKDELEGKTARAIFKVLQV